MNKILLAAVLAAFSCAAFGQTTVVGSCSVPSQPCNKARIALTGQVAAISATTLYTPSAAGTYRVTITAYPTVVGTAGTFQTFVTYNTGSGSISVFNASTATTALTADSGSVIRMHVGAGQAIQYGVTFSGVTGSFTYGLDVVVEQVQ